MNAKRAIAIGMLVVGAFAVGTQTKLRRTHIITYRIGNSTVAFTQDNPLSGLQTLQFAFVLEMIRKGETNRALAKLETMLDFAIDDAKHRRPLLPGDGLRSLDRVLIKVADYRARFPRGGLTNDVSSGTAVPQESAWSRSVDEANSRWRSEIDAFIGSFTKTNLVE